MKKVLRILGSVMISFFAAIYLFIMVGSAFDGEELSLTYESLGIIILGILTVISAVWVWVNPRTGAYVALIVGILFSIFGVVTAGQNWWMALLAAGGPIIVGSLMVIIELIPIKKKST